MKKNKVVVGKIVNAFINSWSCDGESVDLDQSVRSAIVKAAEKFVDAVGVVAQFSYEQIKKCQVDKTQETKNDLSCEI